MRSVDRDVLDALLGLGALEAVEVPVDQAADGDQGLAHQPRELVLHVAGDGAAQGVQEDEEGGEVHPPARGRRGRRRLLATGRRLLATGWRLLATGWRLLVIGRRLAGVPGRRRLLGRAVGRAAPGPRLPCTWLVLSPVHRLPLRRTPRAPLPRTALRWSRTPPSRGAG